MGLVYLGALDLGHGQLVLLLALIQLVFNQNQILVGLHPTIIRLLSRVNLLEHLSRLCAPVADIGLLVLCVQKAVHRFRPKSYRLI